MTTALTAFYDDVLPQLPGLTPGAAVLKFIRDAAIEFCHRSRVWKIDHPLMDIVALAATYTFAPGADMQVVTPVKVRVNGLSIGPSTDDDLDLAFGDSWANGTLAAGEAQTYRIPDEGHIQIVPAPDTSIPAGLFMRVAVKPTGTATGVDDRLYNEISYRNAISAGVLWKAKSNLKRPYSDAQGAIDWKHEFDRLIGAADMRAARGLSNRPARTGYIHGIE